MDQPNIILIIVDTLRSDTIDFLKLKSANDPFYKDFAIYNNCVSASPWTIPSHASIFTGKFPTEHKIHEDRDHKVSADLDSAVPTEMAYKTVFQCLKRKGYSNYGITRNINIRPGTVFERGFDVFQFFDFPFGQYEYSDFLSQFSKLHGELSRRETALMLLKERRFYELAHLYASNRRIKKTGRLFKYPVEKGASFILKTILNSSLLKPFSLFINIMEMHEPYPTKMSLLDQYRETINYGRMKINKLNNIRREYMLQGQRVGEFLRSLFSSLKSMNEWDNTMIIVTSDHGQSLWENGFGGHGTFLYNELIKVPLLVKYPGNINSSVYNSLYSHVNLFQLIDRVSDGSKSALVSSEVTFSESFGILHNMIPHIKSINPVLRKAIESKLNSLDYRRISAFKSDIKLTLNADSGDIIEYLEKNKPADANRGKIMESGIIDDIEIFDRAVVVPFR